MDIQPIIHLITTKATQRQIDEMASFYVAHIKLAVDIEKGILAGGGEWHSDCEKVLIANGSQQKDVWGGGYKPFSKEVDFYSLINIRPKAGNPDQDILSPEIRSKFEKITRQILEI